MSFPAQTSLGADIISPRAIARISDTLVGALARLLVEKGLDLQLQHGRAALRIWHCFTTWRNLHEIHFT